MAQIKLLLQDTKRIIPIGIDGFKIDVTAPGGYKVIAGENNVTAIQIEHGPLWDGWVFEVLLKNANNAWETASPDGTGTFLISDAMTYKGYTRIYISCRKADMINRWERFDLKVWSTSPNWTKDAEHQYALPIPAPDQAGKVIMVSPDGRYILGNGGEGIGGVPTIVLEDGVDVTQDVILEISYGSGGESSMLVTPEELGAVVYTNTQEPYTEVAPVSASGYLNNQEPYTK